ncbi:hypothetical protein QYF36_016550 [Acer negundo]|nr:hypothetical protein QYF36_016550 [Acer negundo]
MGMRHGVAIQNESFLMLEDKPHCQIPTIRGLCMIHVVISTIWGQVMNVLKLSNKDLKPTYKPMNKDGNNKIKCGNNKMRGWKPQLEEWKGTLRLLSKPCKVWCMKSLRAIRRRKMLPPSLRMVRTSISKLALISFIICLMFQEKEIEKKEIEDVAKEAEDVSFEALLLYEEFMPYVPPIARPWHLKKSNWNIPMRTKYFQDLILRRRIFEALEFG